MLIPYLTSGGTEYKLFKSYTETAIDVLLSRKVEISNTGSTGGYQSVFKPCEGKSPIMEYLVACGNFGPDQYGRFFYNSFEKSKRLNDHIFSDGHITSGQSANPDQMEFEGAVFFKELNRIFSFSGVKAEFDLFLSILSGSFNSYSQAKRAGESATLEDVPRIFSQKIHLIPATKYQLQNMSYAMGQVVEKEIALRDKK